MFNYFQDIKKYKIIITNQKVISQDMWYKNVHYKWNTQQTYKFRIVEYFIFKNVFRQKNDQIIREILNNSEFTSLNMEI